jgi:hypothetical protein
MRENDKMGASPWRQTHGGRAGHSKEVDSGVDQERERMGWRESSRFLIESAFCTCQALTTCGKPGDVLRLLDEFRRIQQVVSTSGRVWRRLLS